MINIFFDTGKPIMAFSGIILAFVLTCFGISMFRKFLPKDIGRAYAHNGNLSAGKPRGAGFIFVLVFILCSVIFAKTNRENLIYLILIGAAMLTGFLDDASKAPWGELRKGILDLVIAVMTALTFYNANGSTIDIISLGKTVTLPPVAFIICAVILIWVSINVTNCADGVDGLSGTLSIISLITIYGVLQIKNIDSGFDYMILLFIVCLLGYLWYNATPSQLLMGDAGSRAMGLVIAIAALKMESPILYIPIALVIVMDGGLGLIKVSLLRFFKIHILKNTKTPLHDQVRKVNGWSNTQTVFRFSIIQIIVEVAVLYLVMMNFPVN